MAILVGMIAVPAPASAETYEFTSEVVSAHSGKCLEVNGWSTSNGGNVDQWDCHGGGNQQWDFISESDGGNDEQLVNQHSGLCLDVVGKKTTNGANVHQWGCQYREVSQTWLLWPHGSANGWYYYTITNAHASYGGLNMCLDVNQGGTSDGTNVQIWQCNGSQNQLWRMRH